MRSPRQVVVQTQRAQQSVRETLAARSSERARGSPCVLSHSAAPARFPAKNRPAKPVLRPAITLELHDESHERKIPGTGAPGEQCLPGGHAVAAYGLR